MSEDVLERLRNRDEVARRMYMAMWLQGTQAEAKWEACTASQREFWLKAAENVEAYVLTGTSPEGGDHTPVKRLTEVITAEVPPFVRELMSEHPGHILHWGVRCITCAPTKAEAKRYGLDGHRA